MLPASEIAWSVGLNLASAAIGYSISRGSQDLQTDSRLTGRWDGDLAPQGNAGEEFPTHVIRWQLVLAKPSRQQNCGLLYYRRECTATGVVIAQGMDELRDYYSERRYMGRTCKLQFARVFHKRGDGSVEYANRLYDVRLTFDGRAARKVKIGTEIVNGASRDAWAGLLLKQ